MGRRVLVVDDEIDVETMIRQRFRAEIKQGKYDFVFARDGVQALEIFHELEEAPVVVTDIRMPRMDGLSLLSEISRLDPVQRVVIVSAYGDMNNIRAAMNSGALDFLTKPMDFEDFQSTVDRATAHIDAQEESHKRHAELAGLKHELELARKIQMSILPRKMPEVAGLNLFSLYEPMSAVGGDFYGFYQDDRGIGILVADVVGHGVPAAMIASMVRVAFNLQRDRAHDAVEVLLGMERVLNESGMIETNFVTACYSFIDLKSGRLQTANAGHPPLLIHRQNTGEVLALRPGGSMLGFYEANGGESAAADISPGDRVFAYTDGFLECGYGANTFGQDRLSEFFRDGSKATPGEFMRTLIDNLKDWNRRYGESDDFDDDLTAVIADIRA